MEDGHLPIQREKCGLKSSSPREGHCLSSIVYARIAIQPVSHLLYYSPGRELWFQKTTRSKSPQTSCDSFEPSPRRFMLTTNRIEKLPDRRRKVA